MKIYSYARLKQQNKREITKDILCHNIFKIIQTVWKTSHIMMPTFIFLAKKLETKLFHLINSKITKTKQL
jgi:hypothetical protein